MRAVGWEAREVRLKIMVKKKSTVAYAVPSVPREESVYSEEDRE
jgi:hypothetical protein